MTSTQRQHPCGPTSMVVVKSQPLLLLQKRSLTDDTAGSSLLGSDQTDTNILTTQVVVLQQEPSSCSHQQSELVVVSSNNNDNNSTISPRTNVWFGHRLWRRHLKSLSRAATTPCWVSILLPLFSLATHLLFYYGQTAPMWQLHLSEQVDLWANATNMEARAAFHTIGLPHENYIGAHHEKQVKTFSYWFAITELWHAKHMPGKVLPRTAAILLVIFSGIWPHVKLLLLNCTWLFSVHQTRRTRTLMWLSTLGKWSLADVLVVCVMVGVLHLDWNVDPQAIRDGLVEHLPFCLQVVKSLYSASDICTLLLKDVDCHIHHESWKRWTECKACVGLIKSALDHPETARNTFRPVLDGIEMSGGGHASLRVMGLKGIYAFCLAVIVSIFLSLVVDILDVRAHQANVVRARRQRSHPSLLPNGDDDEDALLATEFDNHYDDDDSHDGDSYAMDQPLLLTRNNHDDDEMEESGRVLTSDRAYHELLRSTASAEPPRTLRLFLGLSGVWLLTMVTAAAVLAGIFSNTIQRSVHGAIPDVLRLVLGVIWNRDYSLYSLVRTTGAAGSWDYMLMGTFGLFVVIGPAIRAALLCIAWWVPMHGKNRPTLLATIELLGAFCAWEVFAIAVGMVDMLMPAITSTVIINPQCASVSQDGSCLTVNFDLQKSFLWVVLGGGLLIALANLVYGGGRRPAMPSARNSNMLDHHS